MGIFGIPIVESRFFGTATNVESYLKHVRKNDYKNAQGGTGTTVKAATHQSDFVGRIPVILGNNPSTVGTNTKNKGGIRTTYEIFNGKSSVHNCYGLGQRQCVTDGYRKSIDDLQMHKEKTIFDLKQGK